MNRQDEISALSRTPSMNLSQFVKMVKSHFQKHGRSMPWRKEVTPYCIVVSEVMLQQTQVERVLQKYPLFIEQFPDFQTLAQAPLEKVLTVWQGLGYNRRALALKKIAATIHTTYGGYLPQSVDILKTFPCIGQATASSILVFAFHMPLVFIETNIRRVFIHHFFHSRTDVHDNEILPLIEKTLDRQTPHTWYYALMDYGSALKNKMLNPNRRSKHYERQSKFEGSQRQKRGAIVRFVLQHPDCTTVSIARHIHATITETTVLLEKLTAEGFLDQIKNRYRICQHMD
jgi:A/G-specific adenine glycosylase